MQHVNNGKIASIGFKTEIMFYRAFVSSELYLEKAYNASFTMNAKIITSSAGGWSSCPPIDPLEELEDKLTVIEILDNGTTIIMPAGNGVEGNYNTCSLFGPLGPKFELFQKIIE